MAQEDTVPAEWQRWRGGVDNKLDVLNSTIVSINHKVDVQGIRLNALPSEIEARLIKVINGQSNQNITFRWIVEKLTVPILLTLAGIAIGILAGGST